jgi:hypothetical protein
VRGGVVGPPASLCGWNKVVNALETGRFKGIGQTSENLIGREAEVRLCERKGQGRVRFLQEVERPGPERLCRTG